MNRWFLWASVGILVFAPCFACGGGSAGTGPGPDVLDVPSTDGSADLPAEVSLDSAPDAIDIVADAPPDVPDVPVVIEPADRPLCTPVTQAAATVIPIDPAGAGRIFDGLGAISNAGNSRFLIDYPEPQRSQVLDYFFKPGYGAALQVLKVEMAGDMNSTTGSEASHMHTSEGLDCGRGYEWWLMKEAKARNPSIVLAALPWGSPSWTAQGTFFTPELLDYMIAWLDCARTNGLAIDYLGGRNESGWDLDWLKALKARLVQGGYPTKLVAGDTHQTFGWLFPTTLVGDPALSSFDVIGVHYPCYYDSPDATVCDAPEEVLGLGVPIWASEQGGDPSSYGRILTRGYVEARLTAFHHWPLMTSMPEGLGFQDSGLVVAAQPWSGAYTPKALLWTFAHLTQFTQPGWQYLDAASGHLPGDPIAGAYVTLVSPDRSRVTTLIETSTATQEQVVEVAFPDWMPKRIVHVFTSDTSSWDPAAYMVHSCDLDPAAGPVRITVAPHRLVTLTTTVGQVRGDAAGPATTTFPLPYDNDFEADVPGQEARFLMNQSGAFEVGACGGGRSGRCIRQAAVGKPGFWGPQDVNPFAVTGDSHVEDVTIRVDVMPEAEGTIQIFGRFFNQPYFKPRRYDGYEFRIDTGGAWSIVRHDSTTDFTVTLLSGTAAAWPTWTWRTLELALQGASIRARVDGTELGTATDATWTRGLAGIGVDGGATGAGWHPVQFDNLHILPVTP